MRSFFTLKTLGRIAVGIGALLGLILVVWAVVSGPVVVGRVLLSGFDTRINDYSRYPGRTLAASPQPSPLAEAHPLAQFDATTLAEFGEGGDLDAIVEANDSIALLVIHNDQIVYERYFQGHTPDSLSQAFSMSKSFTSALIGMAIEDGVLEGRDQPVTDLIPELSEKGFDVVTIRDLLTMMSGSDYIEDDNPFAEHVILNFTPRLEQRILAIRMETEPGTVWRYKSGDNALLALMLDRALGDETIAAFAERRLWARVGATHEAIWSLDHAGEDGLEKSWCCLAATARDFSRLGLLYLHGGEWNGDQVVSADWVAESVTPAVPVELWDPESALRNYGYQWWLASEEEGDYMALGKDGQYLYVNPAQDVVIVRLGWSQGTMGTGKWLALFQALAHDLP